MASIHKQLDFSWILSLLCTMIWRLQKMFEENRVYVHSLHTLSYWLEQSKANHSYWLVNNFIENSHYFIRPIKYFIMYKWSKHCFLCNFQRLQFMVTLSYYSAQHSTIKRESHMMVLSRFPPTPISSTLSLYSFFILSTYFGGWNVTWLYGWLKYGNLLNIMIK